MKATCFSEWSVGFQRIMKLYMKENRTFLGISFKIEILQAYLNAALDMMFRTN
jgi:hypothetical protein